MEVRRLSAEYYLGPSSFTVKIDLEGITSTLTFQSFATVDNVKYEIFKQNRDILKDQSHHDYLLALNKRTDVLQIEFVKFIFAHEGIQKALTTKEEASIEVFLVPKPNEIKAFMKKADRIKKQLISISSKQLTKHVVTPSPYVSPNVQSNQSLPSLDICPTSPQPSHSSSSSSSARNSTHMPETTTPTSSPGSTFLAVKRIPRGTFGNAMEFNQSMDGRVDLLPLVPGQASSSNINNTGQSSSTNKSNSKDYGDNLSPRGSRILKPRFDAEDPMDRDILPPNNEMVSLQQQLVDIEDAQLKYLSRSFEDNDNDTQQHDHKHHTRDHTHEGLEEDEDEPLDVLKDVEDLPTCWTDMVSFANHPLDDVNGYHNFPVLVSTSKDMSAIFGCPSGATAAEFRQHIITQMESMIASIRNGSMSLDLSSDGHSPMANDTSMHDLISSSYPGIPRVIVGATPTPKQESSSSNFTHRVPSTIVPRYSTRLQAINKPPIMTARSNNGVFRQQQSRSPICIGSGRDASFSLGEQRDQTIKATVQRRKLAQIHIASLLGRPIAWTKDDSEVKQFRSIMENVFNLHELDKRERIKITLAPTMATKIGDDPLLPTAFHIKVYIPPDNHSTTICVNGVDLISHIIERVVAKQHSATLLLDHKASDFVLRITGTSDHIINDCEIKRLEHVRYRLQRKLDIKFSLVNRSTLPNMMMGGGYIDGASQDIVVINNSIPVRSNDKKATAKSILPQQTAIIGSARYLSLSPAMSASGSTISSKPTRHSILLSEINRPFEIRIICLENLTGSLFSSLTPDAPLNDIKLTIVVSLYHGDDLLTEPLETTFKSVHNPLWCEWLRSTLLLCDVPRAAKVCITMYASVGERPKISIGWADLQLIDHRGNLQNGVIGLMLCPGDRAAASSAVAVAYNQTCPSLVIEFAQFPFPVLSPRPLSRRETRANSSTSPVADNDHKDNKNYVEPRRHDLERMELLIKRHPMNEMSTLDRQFIWMYRVYLKGVYPNSLPRILQCVHWSNPHEVKQVHELLADWPQIPPTDAIELLDIKFADELVREYAVTCLLPLSDQELVRYLLPLVQSLKHEPYHDSSLGRFLIQRALANRAMIGHRFFWLLEAELHDPRHSDRCALILETFLKGCGDQRHEFVKQMEVVTKLCSIAQSIKLAPTNKRKQMLHDELTRVEWPNTFHLPTSVTTQACGIIIDECRWLDSSIATLLLVFQNVDPMGDPIRVVYRHGDDLRQDMFTLNMMSLMDDIWKSNGLDLHMSIYNVTATGERSGFIEVMVDTPHILANIHKETNTISKIPGLAGWIKERNQSDADYESAVQNFIHSLAGYSVATHSLGIGDRQHDDTDIMVTNSGHLLHKDFAHFLGSVRKSIQSSSKKDKVMPLIVTAEFVTVMGGEKSSLFKWFSDLCCLSFDLIRKHVSLFIVLFKLVLSTGISELSRRSDIEYLRSSFMVEAADDEQAKQSFETLIQKSLRKKTTPQ
ncbi:hypothetical protein SAMD00019534_031730 [Acytostelium subglobosum LB1]|uniref:hypothetical protein n=1 Tax=Acytostelium subglobosum LB1 TaxID=1410327 RepID=UPI0006451609|nr:hypothetical protein SAMD00019534_031730 [Acytostelium subglobosum LB1]GAM19998.1 hypothetical protein SAMD00019534_031730 [Acytostelium subglobosum LB1]|eukprot:XP_012756760.1 hypothetical protein SAMD00019534_031730 [Acytostelium subglobosum LB1]